MLHVAQRCPCHASYPSILRHQLSVKGANSVLDSLAAMLAHVARLQRVVIVALGLVPLILVTVVSLPALLVLPFFPSGLDRAGRIINCLKIWSVALLRGSKAE